MGSRCSCHVKSYLCFLVSDFSVKSTPRHLQVVSAHNIWRPKVVCWSHQNGIQGQCHPNPQIWVWCTASHPRNPHHCRSFPDMPTEVSHCHFALGSCQRPAKARHRHRRHRRRPRFGPQGGHLSEAPTFCRSSSATAALQQSLWWRSHNFHRHTRYKWNSLGWPPSTRPSWLSPTPWKAAEIGSVWTEKAESAEVSAVYICEMLQCWHVSSCFISISMNDMIPRKNRRGEETCKRTSAAQKALVISPLQHVFLEDVFPTEW